MTLDYRRKFDRFALKPYTLTVRKVVTILTAIIYLGFANYCLTYAAITKSSHCLPTTVGRAPPHEDHDHDADHEGHSETPTHHDHSPNSSDPCCVKIGELGVALQSAPQILAAAITISPVFLHTIVADTSAAANDYFRRTDHGPPKTAGQEVSLSYRAPRAPPFVA